MIKVIVLAVLCSMLTACPEGGGGGGFGDGGYGGGSAFISEPYMHVFATPKSDLVVARSTEVKLQTAAERLTNKYGFSEQKSMEIVAALELWSDDKTAHGTASQAVADTAFKTLFGVERAAAFAAVKALSFGQTKQMTELTAVSAENLGISRADAQAFMKDMYKNALKKANINANAINW